MNWEIVKTAHIVENNIRDWRRIFKFVMLNLVKDLLLSVNIAMEFLLAKIHLVSTEEQSSVVTFKPMIISVLEWIWIKSLLPKGQLISEQFFGVFKSSKKWTFS